MADKNKNKNKKVVEEEIEEDEAEQQTAGKYNTSAADLAKVSSMGLYDDESQNENNAKDISGAMSIIDSNRSKEEAERAAKKKELDRVKIRKEDVEFIMQEMELSKAEAELKLRHASGNVVEALVSIINA